MADAHWQHLFQTRILGLGHLWVIDTVLWGIPIRVRICNILPFGSAILTAYKSVNWRNVLSWKLKFSFLWRWTNLLGSVRSLLASSHLKKKREKHIELPKTGNCKIKARKFYILCTFFEVCNENFKVKVKWNICLILFFFSGLSPFRCLRIFRDRFFLSHYPRAVQVLFEIQIRLYLCAVCRV